MIEPKRGRGGAPSALFVGISTLDIAHLVDRYPVEDTKNRAVDQFLGAGGPASNAAIAFAFLSGRSARLLTALGRHYLADVIRADLHEHSVQVVDATPNVSEQPPVSSITVSREHGRRTIVSLDDSRITASFDDSHLPAVEAADIVLVDGYCDDLCIRSVQHARRLKIPVVLDGGRWKSSYESVLPAVDVAICSSAFAPPGIQSTNAERIFDYLHSVGVPFAAISRGSEPIEYSIDGKRGTVPIPPVPVVDTLGAGDILHGAFCHYFSQPGGEFVEALSRAARVVSTSCECFGTRGWMSRARLRLRRQSGPGGTSG